MRHTTLIVPGFRGSGVGHWQTWMQEQLPEARRVGGIDWDSPVLAHWAGQVVREIDASTGAVWLVAHSFGCLASVAAAVDRPAKVAGLLLVAPADPERFSPLGPREIPSSQPSVTAVLPHTPLGVASLLVASTNDPWLDIDSAMQWAERWGSRLLNLGAAGHINTEAGFGAWPYGLKLLRCMQHVHDGLPLGSITGQSFSCKGRRRGALARLRHQARFNLGY